MTQAISWQRAVGVVALVVGLGALGWQASTQSVDFPIYHRVAAQLLAGDAEIYPTEVYGGGTIPPHGFRYLPVIAFLFMPLALLPLPLAAAVFFAVKLAVLAWTGRTVARHAGVAEGWAVPLTGLVIVAGYAAEELRYGNAHLLTVALMVFAYDRAWRGMVAAPALALALAIATKITPLALLGYFALRQRVAVCAATAAAVGLLLVLPAPLVGWEMNRHLLTGFARYAVQKIDETDNYSLRGALERLASAESGGLAAGQAPASRAVETTVTWSWLLVLAGLGFVILVVLWRRPPDDLIALLEFAIVLVVMLIGSPHTQRRYYMQLFVPAVALLGLMRVDHGRYRGLAVVGLAATAAAGTLLPLVFGGRRLALAYESTAPYFWGAAVLLVVLLRAVALTKQRPDATPN